MNGPEVLFAGPVAMSAANKAVLSRYFLEVWGQGRLALVDALFARDWVGHAPPKEFNGPAALKRFIVAQRRACPDLQVTVDDQIAEGDKVATRWTARSALLGAGADGTPTGLNGLWTGITVARLAGGKIIEAWTQSQSLAAVAP